MRIVLATDNRDKVVEIRKILCGIDVEILTLDKFPEITMPPETGLTFEDNAVAKAKFVSSITNLPTLADDSGIEVSCLDGKPGVFSARYAGVGATYEENNQKLLSALTGVPVEKRGARLVCVIAYSEPGANPATFEGTLEGFVTEKPTHTHGFGFEPLFFVPERKKTLAELGAEEKNKISHRARALKKFKAWLISSKKSEE